MLIHLSSPRLCTGPAGTFDMFNVHQSLEALLAVGVKCAPSPGPSVCHTLKDETPARARRYTELPDHSLSRLLAGTVLN